MKKITELELLQDTINFYGADPEGRRSTNEDGCAYNGPNGEHCAVGRFLMPRFKEQGGLFEYNTMVDACELFEGLGGVRSLCRER